MLLLLSFNIFHRSKRLLSTLQRGGEAVSTYSWFFRTAIWPPVWLSPLRGGGHSAGGQAWPAEPLLATPSPSPLCPLGQISRGLVQPALVTWHQQRGRGVLQGQARSSGLCRAETTSSSPLLELLTPALTRVAAAAKTCRWAAELAPSPAWGLFLRRCNHCPYLLLPRQCCASAVHYSSHYFITRESWFFTEAIFSWLNSHSRVSCPLKLSLVLTWNIFPLINLWTLWFYNCIWKILNVIACLCFLLFIFCLEKYLSTFLWRHLFSPGLGTCTLRFVGAVWWHTSLRIRLFAQILAHCWYLIAVIIIISRPQWEVTFIINKQ